MAAAPLPPPPPPPPPPAAGAVFGPGGRFVLERPLASGSFGDVWAARDTAAAPEGLCVAVKLEAATAEHPQLAHEASVMRELGSPRQPAPGLPVVLWEGAAGPAGYRALVQPLLGPSLEQLFDFCGRRLSLGTTLQLGVQLLRRLEAVHAAGFLHRDVKPDNILMGVRGPAERVAHLVDYGLSKRYRNADGAHIGYRDGKPQLTGTARYASIAAHHGVEASRRDDLESLGYVLLYLLRGSLPWQGLRGPPDAAAKQQRIAAVKAATTPGGLAAGLPAELAAWVAYTRGLAFAAPPDYDYLRRLLTTAGARAGLLGGGSVFDWQARGPVPSPRWPAPQGALPPQPPPAVAAAARGLSSALDGEEVTTGAGPETGGGEHQRQRASPVAPPVAAPFAAPAVTLLRAPRRRVRNAFDCGDSESGTSRADPCRGTETE